MEANVRRLFVTWRQPHGLIVPVGLLRQFSSPEGVSYEFVYLKLAEQQEDFEPLPGLMDLYKLYESPTLFPVFANRQMPRERPDYDAFVQRLHLAAEADPFEVLARSEGMRATDRIEVFAAPSKSETDDLVALFFVRGIRHVGGASEAVSGLELGEEVRLVQDQSNPVNPRALLVSTRTGESVGYAPDYLLDTIADLEEQGSELRVTVEHINPLDSPAHTRLLCRLAGPWPIGFEPLSGPDFQPLVGI